MSLVRGLDHVAQLAQCGFVLPVLQMIEIEDDLQFLRTKINGNLRFVPLHIAIARAQRKADQGHGLHTAVLKPSRRQRDA